MKNPLIEQEVRSNRSNRSTKKPDSDSVHLIGAIDISPDYNANHTADRSADHQKEAKYSEANAKNQSNGHTAAGGDKAKGDLPKYDKANLNYVNYNEEDQMVSAVCCFSMCHRLITHH